jgi:hypothetical protein
MSKYEYSNFAWSQLRELCSTVFGHVSSRPFTQVTTIKAYAWNVGKVNLGTWLQLYGTALHWLAEWVTEADWMVCSLPGMEVRSSSQ